MLVERTGTEFMASWAPKNRHLVFLGPKFTTFLPEPWFLVATSPQLSSKVLNAETSLTTYLICITDVF